MSAKMELFPPIPMSDWEGTKQTLHRWLQIVGKIRLQHSPRRNHWWHVPFHLTGGGLTTRPMGLVDGNPLFTIDFDFQHHLLRVTTVEGPEASFPLPGQTVASFFRDLTEALHGLGIRAEITHPYPFDLPDADRPFDQDTEHDTYDAEDANRYWRVLSQVGMVLEMFAAGYSGKTSPVHHFWHTFDIAATRFSDRRIEHPREAGAVIREAYSRDVVSFGFWFGDDNVPEPTFYAYASPEPDAITRVALPQGAHWIKSGHGHLAQFPYDAARRAPDPVQAVLAFYESAYAGSAELLGWNTGSMACPHGVTDPHLGGRG
jgi:hypothetical protein